MNSTEESKVGFLQSENHSSTPLLQATDMEQPAPPPLPPERNVDEHDTTASSTHVAVVNEHVPVLVINKAFDFTGHVDCTFEKVFPEARGSQSLHAVTQCMKQAFSLTQRVTYIILTVFLATFLVIIWGFLFALFNFLIVWIFQPSVKFLFIFLRLSGDVVRVLIRLYLQPCFQAASAIYSNFRGNFNVNVAAQDLSTDDLPVQTI